MEAENRRLRFMPGEAAAINASIRGSSMLPEHGVRSLADDATEAGPTQTKALIYALGQASVNRNNPIETSRAASDILVEIALAFQAASEL